MYVCNCNGITQRQVRAAKDAGARRWTDVHAHYGHQPCCGGCGVEMSEMLRDGVGDAHAGAGLLPGLAKA
jgi:bacterioferritin-associated ferredoxin